ncbi:MAG: hypothetical protein ACE5H4_08285 [Candidatus Thorarchaeota archaeon]
MARLLNRYEGYWEADEEYLLKTGENFTLTESGLEQLSQVQKAAMAISQLTESECQELLELGRSYLEDGQIERVGDLAFIYSVADGFPPPGMTFDTGYVGVPGSLLQSYFIAYCLSPLFGHDETIVYHDRVRLQLHKPPNGRVGDLFLTNKRIFVLGRRNLYDSKGPDIYQIIYPDLNEKKHFIGLDYIDLESIKRFVTKKDRIDITAHLTYGRAKSTTIHGPLWVKLEFPKKITMTTGDFHLRIEPGVILKKYAREGWDEKKRIARLSQAIEKAKQPLESQ